MVGHQSLDMEVSPDHYATEIAPARTFGFEGELAQMRNMGLIRGASLENAVCFNATTVLNEGGLRFPDECCRHKALDLIGDLALIGSPLLGHVIAERAGHFTELADSDINQTELIAALINQEDDIVSGISRMQEEVVGSCSLLLLTDKGIYAARDKLGRTPVILGQKDGGYCATFESSAMINLDYKLLRELGPGEIVFITPEGVEQRKAPGKKMRICTFLWVYFGFPASCYEGVNAEDYRYKCGASMAMRDDVEVDMVAGVPDSGTGSSIGYANQKGVPFGRPFVKYTPTWPRSFMPPNQSMRDLVARMKLQPIESLIRGKRLLFCEDSIVRGTQLQDTIERLYSEYGAKEVHMRPACPPLVFGCKYLNFSRSRSVDELATRIAIKELEGEYAHLDEYADASTERYQAMVQKICERLNLTSLRFQTLDDLIKAIGLPKEKLCTYCWDGKE
ncbi:MAG: UDP-3-O-acyl-N-acetylglucosamine deacetylase [Kiritimatiellales bacterium]